MTWSRGMGWSLGLTQMVNDPNQDESAGAWQYNSRNATQQQRFLSIASEQENKRPRLFAGSLGALSAHSWAMASPEQPLARHRYGAIWCAI